MKISSFNIFKNNNVVFCIWILRDSIYTKNMERILCCVYHNLLNKYIVITILNTKYYIMTIDRKVYTSFKNSLEILFESCNCFKATVLSFQTAEYIVAKPPSPTALISLN